MIIACPECESPFELRDESIAELVQIGCPTCSFRMILDFAAANDASLVEEGMQMASGFRSAADYYAASAPASTEPEPLPEPELELPAPPEPEPVAPEPEPEPEPIAPAPEPIAPAPEPVTPEPALELEEAQPSPDTRATIIGIAAPSLPEPARPEPARPALELEAPVQYEPDDAPTQVRDRVEVPEPEPTPEPEPEPTPEPEPEPTPEPEPAPRRAPHSLEAERPRPAPKAPPAPMPEAADIDDDLDMLPTGMNPVLKVIAILTAVAALGLVGASLALEGTPDPRPLLQKYMK